MIKKIINGSNLQKACQKVMSNKGSAGIDGMSVQELSAYLGVNKEQLALAIEGASEADTTSVSKRVAAFEANRIEIINAIQNGSYMPQAILGVEIPKDNGKKRLLGIPTVTDRLLQQAVHQVIYPKFEIEFKAHSYGFRPKRSALHAVLKAQEYIHDGYQHIVDIDLKNFFDEVDHCILLQLLYRKIKCPLTLRLIRKWLRAPISINGKLTKRRKGVPQGSPLSPLLSNIMLHELDKELERQGLRYVRYADDFSIYTRTEKNARKVGNQIYLFLKNKLKLPINREKSGIRKPVNFEILGYKFVPSYIRGDKGKFLLGVADKNWKKLKQNLKQITRKTAPKSFSERIRQLKEAQRGWVNYYRIAHIHHKLQNLDSWLRSRLRYCIWKDWKKAERKRKNLIRLGVDQNHAYSWSRTRMGGWAVALSPILITTITLKRLAKRGYVSMLEHYVKVSPQFNEPLYTRPVRTVV